MKILVTGANGFVGQALCRRLSSLGHSVVRGVRSNVDGPDTVAVGELNADTDWREALAGCEAVVHLAARVHVTSDTADSPLQLYRKTNTEGTLNLARQALAEGVRRFVFISSIKVNGEGGDTPYQEGDPPCPEDPYAVSKWEAEQGLWKIAAESGLELVILRPPLVYGPGVRANFLALMRMVATGWPLPLGAVRNRRSLIGLDNLIDVIRLALIHPRAAGRTYLVSDGQDVSTPQLLTMVAEAMGKTPRLFPLPPSFLRLIGWLLGRGCQVDRLLNSLAVDTSLVRSELDWTPPCSMWDGIVETVAWFEGSGKR